MEYNNIREEIIDKLLKDFAAESPVRVAGGLAFLSNYPDKVTGNLIPVEITVTLKNTSHRGPTYSIEKAAEQFKNRPGKRQPDPQKVAVREAEKSAARERRDVNVDILRRWVNTHMRIEDRLSASQIQAAIPEFTNFTRMQVGTYLMVLVNEKLLTYELDRNRKKVYKIQN